MKRGDIVTIAAPGDYGKPHQGKEALRRVGAGQRMRDIARSYNGGYSRRSRLAV